MNTVAYEDTSTAVGIGAFPPETLDLAIRLNLVVLQDRHLDLLALMLDALGGGVGLLLALLGTTTKTKNKMKGRLLLNVIITEGAAVFELLSGEDQALLIRGNAKGR